MIVAVCGLPELYVYQYNIIPPPPKLPRWTTGAGALAVTSTLCGISLLLKSANISAQRWSAGPPDLIYALIGGIVGIRIFFGLYCLMFCVAVEAPEEVEPIMVVSVHACGDCGCRMCVCCTCVFECIFCILCLRYIYQNLQPSGSFDRPLVSKSHRPGRPKDYHANPSGSFYRREIKGKATAHCIHSISVLRIDPDFPLKAQHTLQPEHN